MMPQKLLSLLEWCKGGTNKLVFKKIFGLSHPCSALAYSNLDDIQRWGFLNEKYRHTSWHWGSNWVLEKADAKPGERLLDLGCVNNPYVITFCRNNPEVDAVFLDLAAQPAEEMPPNATYRQHDLTHGLPFEDGSFDVVISESTLEHLPVEGRLLCLKEACRVLKPAGRLALSIGYVLGLNNKDKVRLIATHEFFTKRHCAVFFPVDINLIVDVICKAMGTKAPHPDKAYCFPGFNGFSEDFLWKNSKVIVDRFSDHPEVPALLKDAATVEFGVFFLKPGPPRQPTTGKDKNRYGK